MRSVTRGAFRTVDGPRFLYQEAVDATLGSVGNRAQVILDVGALMGSLVGSIEANVRRAIAVVIVPPCPAAMGNSWGMD